VRAVAEKPVERFVVGQVLDRGELEPREAHVIRVQVDGDDACRAMHEVVEDVASAARDRQHARLRSELERRGVDPRVLPDLVVDEATKPEREHPLEDTPLGREAMVVDRFLETLRVARAGGDALHDGMTALSRAADGMHHAGRPARRGLGRVAAGRALPSGQSRDPTD
jgi:hypothetical protein